MALRRGRLVVALTLGAACGAQAAMTAVPQTDATAAMARFLERPPTAHAYQAERRLEAAGSGMHAWLDVRTDFSPESGMQYEITAEGGSGYIRSRVLRSLLEEERRLIAGGRTADVAISAANYRFTPDRIDADGMAQVMIQPLRKERPLIIGRMFLHPGDGDLARVEGKLAKNPSFWIKGVHVVRSYRRINGALVPVSLESTAQLRLLGRSTLRMTYDYATVDGQPVGTRSVNPDEAPKLNGGPDVP